MNTISQWSGFPSIVDAAIDLLIESRKTPYVLSIVFIYGLDLLREIFVLLHPRATSPIDFSIHALEILTWEGNDCPHSNSYVFSADQSSSRYIFNVFSLTRPGRESGTSSTG
jgi:hypothetical protein